MWTWVPWTFARLIGVAFSLACSLYPSLTNEKSERDGVSWSQWKLLNCWAPPFRSSAAGLSNINWCTIKFIARAFSFFRFFFKRKRMGYYSDITTSGVCNVTALGDRELKISMDAEWHFYIMAQQLWLWNQVLQIERRQSQLCLQTSFVGFEA